MDLVIRSSKKGIKDLLDKSSKQVSKQSKGLAEFEVKELGKDEYLVHIDYALSNPVFNWKYKKSLKAAINDFDPNATFRDWKPKK